MLGEFIKLESSPGHRLLQNTTSYIKRQIVTQLWSVLWDDPEHSSSSRESGPITNSEPQHTTLAFSQCSKRHMLLFSLNILTKRMKTEELMEK